MYSPISGRADPDHGVSGHLSEPLRQFAAEFAAEDDERVAIVDRAGNLCVIENRRRPGRHGFRVDPWPLVEMLDNAVAVLHTHPNGQPYPSATDQAQQIASALPWGIAPRGGDPFLFGEPEVEPDFESRGFRWGATDCYAWVRYLYATRFGIRIGNHVRPWGKRGRSARPFHLFELEGFEVLGGGLDEIADGDGVLLGKTSAGPWAHCGVAIDGALWHHSCPGQAFNPTWRPSRIPLHRIRGIAHCVVRRA